MKLSKSLALLFSLTCGFSTFLNAESKEIIDCDFSKTADKNQPQLLEEKDKDRTPFKCPTHSSAMAPSTIEVKKNGEGAYKDPLVVFTLGPRPESPEAVANAKLTWDLRKAKLGSKGIYEVTYTVVPLKLPIFGGRMQFHLVDKDGVPLSDTVIHISALPNVGFGGNELGTTKDRHPVKEGKSYEVKIVLDLDKNRWSAWLDNKPMVKKEPFPEALTNAYPVLGLSGISFGSEGGLADRPGCSYGLGAVKMKRTSAEPE